MPTKREREYYAMGYRDGIRHGSTQALGGLYDEPTRREYTEGLVRESRPKPPKRKLSAWQKFIKNKRNHITYRDGKLNLKAMGVQYRKKKRR